MGETEREKTSLLSPLRRFFIHAANPYSFAVFPQSHNDPAGIQVQSGIDQYLLLSFAVLYQGHSADVLSQDKRYVRVGDINLSKNTL